MAQPPFGCVFDFDGTLAAIRRDPGAPRLSRRRMALLRELLRVADTVAVISGRARADLEARLPLPGLLLIGGHGNEWPGETVDPPSAEWWAAAERMLQAVLAVAPRARVERKPSSVTVHTRGLDVAPDAFDALMRESEQPGQPVIVRPARRGVELFPPAAPSKGSALRRLVAMRGLRAVVACGDDVTDWAMFTAIGQLRTEGVVGVSVLVRSRETPDTLAEPDIAVDGVDGVDPVLRVLTREATRLRDPEADR